MTERERSGIPWWHELALCLSTLAALAALVPLCCVGCATSTPDRRNAPIGTSEVSTAVAATVEVALTAMASAPTPTAIPTPTPLPALTRLEWGLEIVPQLDIMEGASRTIASLMRSPLLGDATWTALIAAQVVKIREVDAALRRIVPPEECQEAHAMLLSATGDSLLGAEYTLKGVQQLDPALLAQGTEYVALATAKMNLLGLMIEAMTP